MNEQELYDKTVKGLKSPLSPRQEAILLIACQKAIKQNGDDESRYKAAVYYLQQIQRNPDLEI